MKFIKRFFLFILVLLVLLVGAAFAIPYFFRDEIIETVKAEVNNRLDATVDFKDVDISIFRSFPDLSVGLKDFSVIGKNEFAETTLAAGKSFDLTLDIMTVINGSSIAVKKMHLEQPEINVLVLKNGKANYDIYQSEPTLEATTPTEEAGEMVIELSKYSIADGKVTYTDRTMPMKMELLGLNHSGEGNFASTIYDLNTKTDIQSMSVEYDGINYFVKSRADLDAILSMDMTGMKFTLKDNNLQINDLALTADGFVALPNDKDIEMDLTFNVPQNDFKNLLSIIPNAYTEGYQDVKATGSFKLAGFVKGTYNDKTYPAFKMDLDVKGADIKYPDLPMSISGIDANMMVNSPSTDLNNMVVDIPKFKLKIGSNPIAGYFKLKTPMTDPDIDTKIDGKLNLAELAKAFPMEGVKEMNGLITANILAKTKMSTIDREDYENVDMAGTMRIEKMNYTADGMPNIRINDMNMDFTPQNVKVDNFDAKLGAKSDIQASGTLDNILAYFSPEKTMRGDLKMRSNYFDADEWMTEEETTSTTAPTSAEAPTAEEAVFDRFDFTVDAEMKQIKYAIYDLKNLRAKGNFTPSKLSISDFYTNIGESDIAATGYVTNVMNYLYEGEKLGGNIDMRSNYFNVNPFMETEESAASNVPETPTNTDDLEPILVPDNIEMLINADMKKVLYTDLEMTNVTGRLNVADEAVVMENVSGNTLGGKILFSGGYDTKDHDNPAFNIKYDLQNMNFQRSFEAFNSFQQIAPIGKYMDGVFNTSLVMEGNLGKDFMPDWNTLSADGFLATIEAVVRNFRPLKEVGKTLNMSEFDDFQIKNTKNWVKIKDGMVELQEFDYKWKDIAMKIGGKHGITQENMDYNIFAKIPRELIGKNAAGAAANTGLDWLSGEAGKLGLNIDAGEFVNVQINMKGSIDQPKVSVKLLGTDGKSSVVDAAKDAVKDKAKEELDKQKDRAKDEAQKRADEAKAKAKAEADKAVADAKKRAEEEARKAAEKAAQAAKDKVGEAAGEVVGDKAKEEIDKAKDKLDKWNPFGGKKKGGGE